MRIRRGPATVTGSFVTPLSRHWETGKASGGPEPGDLSVRATTEALGGGRGGETSLSLASVRPSPPLGDGRFALLRSEPLARALGIGLQPRRLALHACIGAAAVWLAACGTVPRVAGGIQVVDDAGDTVAVRRPAQRVVSLVPATTELLFAMGAGAQVVGRTSWCDYPEAAALVPDLGDGIGPNIEAVVGQRPDLVVLYRSAQNVAAAERLQSLGIPTIQLSTDLLEDIDRVAGILGRLTGHGAAADSVVRVMHRELDAARVVAPTKRTSVLILVWDNPPMTVGRGSFLSELIDLAGGTNVFSDLPTSSGQVSVEAVAARQPDVILVSGASTPAFTGRPEWQVVAAVRRRSFVRVTSSAFSRPSPRAGAAVRELARQLRESIP